MSVEAQADRFPLRAAEPDAKTDAKTPAPAIPRLAEQRRRRPRQAAADRLRRSRHADRARRHLVLSRISDRPLASRQALRLRAAPRGGRRLLAGHPGRARPHRRSRTCPFSPSTLTVEGEGRDQQLIFRTNLDEIVTAGPRPSAARRNELRAASPRPIFWCATGWKRGSRGRYSMSWSSSARRSGSATTTQFGVWSSGMFFRLGEPRTE